MLENSLREDVLPSFELGVPYHPTCLQTCLVTKRGSLLQQNLVAVVHPGTKQGATGTGRALTYLGQMPSRWAGSWKQSISSAGMRTCLTFLCVQLKNVDLKPICCKEQGD